MPATTTLNLPRLPYTPTGQTIRGVQQLITAPQAYEGEGFPVRRAFAGIPKADLDPFIHMDQMGEIEYAAGEPKGTPWHPHRGFETFTYLIDGQFIHQDSHGGGGVIMDGGTQYMTAGDGILHIETPPEHLVKSGGLFHGVQLWINLPGALKRTTPQYQDLQQHETTVIASPDGGAVIRVLAGNLNGHQGPGISHTPLTITHITVAPGAQVDIPWPREFNALAYVLTGNGTVGIDNHPIHTGQMAVLTNGETIHITAGAPSDSRSDAMEVFLIGGKPLREPVVQYGPFVMRNRAEIIEAFEDYQKGRFGQIPANAIQPYHA